MYIVFFLLSSFFFALNTFAAEKDSVMCTMEYAPVCGSVQMQCATASCTYVRETFGNACMASAAGATDVIVGECESMHPIVGGDLDQYGCKGSAGYSWDTTLSQCIRVWEKPQILVTWAYDNRLTGYTKVSDFDYDRSLSRQEAAAIVARVAEKVWGLRYASYPDNCNNTYTDEYQFDPTLKNDIYSACAFDLMYGQGGVFAPNRTLSRAEALAIIMRGVDGGKKDEGGTIWYQNYADRAHELGILSFADSKGFDAAITRGELIEWIYSVSKYVEQKNIDNFLIGEWILTKHNNTVITNTGYTLNLTATNIDAKFCNNVFGSYIVKDGKFVAPVLASTMMYCEGLPMTLENSFALDGATYGIVDQQKKILTIITTKGDIFIYSQK